MNAISVYIKNMAPYMAYAVPAVFIFRLAAVRQMRKKCRKTTAAHETGVWLFLIFMAGLVSITVIPRNAEGGLTGLVGLQGFARVNLIPFRVVMDSWKEWAAGNRIYPVINIVGNIVMFMPAGFFVSLLWKRDSMKKAALTGFLFSLTVELCQLPQARGTDIDDLWLNTLGAVCGYGVFLMIKRSRPLWIPVFRVKETINIEENGNDI